MDSARVHRRLLLAACGVLALAPVGGASTRAATATATSSAIYQIRADGLGRRRVGGASTRAATATATSSAIYEIRSDGSARRRVGGVGALGFALSMGGSRLAFFRGQAQRASVWIVNGDGSGERELVADDASDPILTEFPLAWSPGGDALAYTAIDTAACGRAQICSETRAVIVDAHDGHVLRAIPGGESLRWSRNGRMAWACDTAPDPYGEREAVCFTLSRGGAIQHVYVGIAHRPLPAPDGGRVAFTDQGGGGLRVLDLGRRSIRALVDPTSAIDGAPTWSPDGRRIAYGTAAGELFTVAIGRRSRRVGRFRDAASPTWGPGARRIAFVRQRLWTVRPDGTGARRVTRDVLDAVCDVDSFTAPSCGPAWSPDGRKLYYLAER